MKNIEKYINEIYEVFKDEIEDLVNYNLAIIDGKVERCEGESENCKFCNFREVECVKNAEKWINEEYKEK